MQMRSELEFGFYLSTNIKRSNNRSNLHSPHFPIKVRPIPISLGNSNQRLHHEDLKFQHHIELGFCVELRNNLLCVPGIIRNG